MSSITGVIFVVFCSFISMFSFAQAGSIDPTFNPGTGIDGGILTAGDVKSIRIQSDKKIIVGGTFKTYNGIGRERILRVFDNGTLDASFDPGLGANNDVLCIIEDNQKIILGGRFTAINDSGRNRIASLNDDGKPNSDFTSSNNNINPFVGTILAQPDGKIMVGGSFSLYISGKPIKNIGRLNLDGSFDQSFNSGTGANSQVYAMVFQSISKLIIIGAFTTYNGTSRKYIARVNIDGTLDTNFDLGTGPDNQITAIAIQNDGKIIIGGWFTSYNGSPVNRIARLNVDGSIDNTFNPGSGPNANISALAIQSDGKIVIAGGFKTYNGTTRNGIARVNFDGTLDNSFDPGYGKSNITTMAIQPDGKILIGGLFTGGIARILGDGSMAVEETNYPDNNQISIFPNPSSDFISIKNRNRNLKPSYKIYNIFSQEILSGQLETETTAVDISRLPQGLFLLQIGETKGITFKFIKN